MILYHGSNLNLERIDVEENDQSVFVSYAEGHRPSEKGGFVMSKQDLLKEYIVQDVICFLTEEDGIEYDEAMNRFYSSLTFDRLQDSETGLYLESPAYVYGIFRDEEKYGTLQDVAL